MSIRLVPQWHAAKNDGHNKPHKRIYFNELFYNTINFHFKPSAVSTGFISFAYTPFAQTADFIFPQNQQWAAFKQRKRPT